MRKILMKRAWKDPQELSRNNLLMIYYEKEPDKLGLKDCKIWKDKKMKLTLRKKRKICR